MNSIGISILVVLLACSSVSQAQQRFPQQQQQQQRQQSAPQITDQVYMDITIGGEDAGRLVIGLYGDVVPQTVSTAKL